MGCDLIVYKPEEGDDGWCGMAYSTFNRLRNVIVKTFIQMKGYELPENNPLLDAIALNSVSYCDAINEILDKISDENIEGIRTLWNHSDCDGEYFGEDCKDIGAVIERILPNVTDIEEWDRGMLESMRDMFKHAGEVDGLVVVC